MESNAPGPDSGSPAQGFDSAAAGEASPPGPVNEDARATPGSDGGDDGPGISPSSGMPDGSVRLGDDGGNEAGSPGTEAGPSPASDGGPPATGGMGFSPQELTFTSTANKANPYMDVGDFKVTFKGPNGMTMTLPGFYTGNQVWKVRFSQPQPVAGTFTYSTSSVQDPSLNGLTGTVPPATPNPTSHGAIRVDPAHPHHYLYADGTRYFQMGYELDWLGLLDFGDPNIAKAKTLIDMVAANGFTEVLMQAYAYDTAWKPGLTSAYDFGPPTQFPWAGTNAAADNTRMNETFWQSYDRVIAYLFEKGITAHIFFKYVRTYGANMLVSWPAHNSPEEDMYFRFLIARYAAYPNVIWDLMKESYHEPDQVYLANRLAFIRANDPYQHLRTIHDSDGGQSQFSPNYYDVPSHAGTFELYTDQQTNQYATAAAAWKKRLLPYMNAEVTLYQIGNDGTFAYKGNPKEDVFRTNLEVLMGGGYFTYYYSIQAWDIVRWNETPNGIIWYKNLIAFIRGTGWYNMAAADALIGGGAIGTHCLADPGKEYIVYNSGSGSVTLNLAGAAAPLAAKWVDLYTGSPMALPPQSNGSHSYTNPFPNPAMLHVGP